MNDNLINYVELNKIRKILILRGEGALGDAVISSFVFREIKKQYPHIKVDAVAFAACADYYSQNKYIDTLYRLPIRSRIRYNQHWPELMFEAFKIRLKKYDLVVDTSDKTTINWRVFKWLCSKKESLFDISNNNGNFGDFSKHRSEHEKLVLESIGFKNLNTAYDVYSTCEADRKINDWKVQKNIQDFVCINAFGSIQERTFNKNSVKAIIENSPENWIFVIPAMTKQIQETISLIPEKSKNKCFFYETANVFELVSLIKNSNLIFTPDTAALHIASGLNKPTIAFYNNYTNYYSPNNLQARIVKTAKENVNDFCLNDLKSSLDELI